VLRYLGEVRVCVDALSVAEAHRRRGVGTQLMDAIERWARERGAVYVMLDTYAGSPLSVPFYEHGMGYRWRSIVFEKRLDWRADVSPGVSPPAITRQDCGGLPGFDP
jgi:GNAT superfamily N-acetyltransferase